MSKAFRKEGAKWLISFQSSSSKHITVFSTEAKMKNLILVALILQLVITNIESNGDGPKPRFGQIFAFPRLCTGDQATYNHVGVYVGKGEGWKDVGQGDNDLFHFTKPGIGQACTYKFDTIKKVEGKNKAVPDTSYDGREGFTVDYDAIAKRIKECNGKTLTYGPIKQNCEVGATYVAYGKGVSEQKGTVVEPLFDKSPVDEEADVHCYLGRFCHFSNP
ncbi:uncharacterized protein LOC131976279 [Centropristis striata]|uniref:uncharacterized protein LOC131976279 n=1 Tax=Centropristis striata TaxID=184440 RepID=UPI0027DF6F03|nr:uncharacterized protein LOC131976279 [Centropristis striata]